MTTAQALAVQPLAFVTAETAFAAYQLACDTGAPGAFEHAAHALSAALRGERARRMAPRPPSGSKPRLVVVNEPAAEAAPPKPRRKAASGGDDLTTALPPQRRTWPVASFVATWADGSETRVQGIGWPSNKAAQRWARAFQAADRLRRIRHARALERELPAEALTGRHTTGPCGVKIDSPAWRELVSCAALPALASLTDETTGETFTAPEGSTYGAGDADHADALLASMMTPLMPWALSEAARCDIQMFGRSRLGVYFIDREHDGERVEGMAMCAPWPEEYRRHRMREALLAFTPAEAAPEPVRAEAVGDRLGTLPDDLTGVRVTVGEELLQKAAGAVERWERRLGGAASSGALEAARARLDAFRDATLWAWTIKRDPGGRAVTLCRPGWGLTIALADVGDLRRVATPG